MMEDGQTSFDGGKDDISGPESPINFSKEEIIKILATKPCLAIRSTPQSKVENEVVNGVELGDFLKISRPYCLDDPDFSLDVGFEHLVEAIEMCKTNHLDILDNEKLMMAIVNNSNFADLYNRSLARVVEGFVNWTLNYSIEGDANGVSLQDKIIDGVTAIELIVPELQNFRKEEYMGFEKNNSTRISPDEIKGTVVISEEEKEEIKALCRSQKSSGEETVRIVSWFLAGKAEETIRENLLTK